MRPTVLILQAQSYAPRFRVRLPSGPYHLMPRCRVLGGPDGSDLLSRPSTWHYHPSTRTPLGTAPLTSLPAPFSSLLLKSTPHFCPQLPKPFEVPLLSPYLQEIRNLLGIAYGSTREQQTHSWSGAQIICFHSALIAAGQQSPSSQIRRKHKKGIGDTTSWSRSL